jgi:mannan endo-1,4-beta-mannosidase
MLPDFLAFHEDSSTLFADDLTGVYDRATTAVAAGVTHLASPADGARVVSGPVELRVSVTGYDVDRVTVTADGSDAEVELAAPGEGELWWTGAWNPSPEDFDNVTRQLTVHTYSGDSELDAVQSRVILGPEPTLAPGVVDDFENYADEAALSRTWVPQNVNTLALVHADTGGVVGGGNSAMRMSYSFASQSYTGIGRQLQADWSTFADFMAWIDPDASDNKLVFQLVADGVAFEAYPSLAGEEPYLATIPFVDWRPAPWDTANADRRLDAETLRAITQFSVFINAVEGAAANGSVVVDELRAVVGEPPAAVYQDVPREHPDNQAVEWLHDNVIDLAAGSGRFQPQRKLSWPELADALAAYCPETSFDMPARGAPTRAEVAVALWSLAGEPAVDNDAQFADVDDTAAYAAAVGWATEAGIIEPVADDRFGPKQPVSRVEFARWLFRFDALPVPQPPVVLFDFADGVQGWHTNGGGTVAAVDGALVVEMPVADWAGSFGGWNLEGRSTLRIDLASTSSTQFHAALQLGPGWTWCETAAAGVEGEASGASGYSVLLDLTTMTEECRGLLREVRGINLHLDAGQHVITAIEAE